MVLEDHHGLQTDDQDIYNISHTKEDMGMRQVLITNNNNEVERQDYIESTDNIQVQEVACSLKYFKFHDFGTEFIMLLTKGDIMP